ncbi:MAG: hypothetical protein AAFW73_10910 [Bacteroidota bacterium]
MKKTLYAAGLVLLFLCATLGQSQAQQLFKFRNHSNCDLSFIAVAQYNCTQAYTPLKTVPAGGSVVLEMDNPVTWGGGTLTNSDLWQWHRNISFVTGFTQGATNSPACDLTANINSFRLAHKPTCGALAGRDNCARVVGSACAPYLEAFWTEDAGNNVIFVDVY